MSGGFHFEVAEEVKQDFYCVICHNLMRDAMQLECDHGMCKTCLERWERNRKESGYDFVCPTCQKQIDKNTVTPARMINKIILSVQVKCEYLNKGCEWIGDLSNMEDHLQQRCAFQLVCCTFEHCEERVERYKLTNHQEKCPYKLEKCQYCNSLFLRLQIQDHYNTCGKFPVKCPNDCSNNLMERELVEHHRSICEEEIVSCEFSSFGCSALCCRKNILKHCQDYCHLHLSSTMKKITALEEELEIMRSMQQEFDTMSREFKSMQAMKEEFETMKILKKGYEDVKAQETNWYSEKLLAMIKVILTDKKPELALGYKEVLEDFDSTFGLVFEGLSNLKSKLDEIDTGIVLEKLLSDSISLKKKEVYIADAICENAKAEVRKQFGELVADYKKEYFETVLSTETRFNALLSALKENKKYVRGGSNFYKISFPPDYISNDIVVDDDFLSCSYDGCNLVKLHMKQWNDGIECLLYNKEIKKFNVYNLNIENLRKNGIFVESQMLIRFSGVRSISTSQEKNGI